MKKLLICLLFLYSPFSFSSWSGGYTTAQASCEAYMNPSVHNPPYSAKTHPHYPDRQHFAACYHTHSNGTEVFTGITAIFTYDCQSPETAQLINGMLQCYFSSCVAGDQRAFYKTKRSGGGALHFDSGLDSDSNYGGCNYTCSNAVSSSVYVAPNGDVMQPVNCVNNGAEDGSYPENLNDPLDYPDLVPDTTSESGCIVGDNGMKFCETDNTDCPTVDGVSLCKTAENPSGCVDVRDLKGELVSLCSGQDKNCILERGRLLCSVPTDSPHKNNCIINDGKKTCLTNDPNAVEVKEESETTTNPDGSVTETTTREDNLSCSPNGRARNISDNPNYWTDGSAVTRDNNGRVNNQYVCPDDKQTTTKTTNPDGSTKTTKTGRLGSDDLSRKGFTSSSGASSSGSGTGTGMSGVESRLDQVNDSLNTIKSDGDDPDGTYNGNATSAITTGLETIDGYGVDYLTDATTYGDSLIDEFTDKANPANFLPDIFPQTLSCNASYIVDEVYNVPFTNKQIEFKFSPCEKFAPIREINAWLFFIFALFKIKNIVFETHSIGA